MDEPLVFDSQGKSLDPRLTMERCEQLGVRLTKEDIAVWTNANTLVVFKRRRFYEFQPSLKPPSKCQLGSTPILAPDQLPFRFPL